MTQLQSIDLPIVDSLAQIRQQITQSANLILQAEPGAGKTTLVPLAMLDLIAAGQKIVMLEPRRLAAQSAALRMANLLNEPVGQTVGYRVKNDSRVSVATRIEVITEGILTRMLQSDPEISSIGLIIFDEFHERSLHADLGLAFALEIQHTLRDDLKLLIMSATLETNRLSELLNNAPIIEISGRSFPVTIDYIAPAKMQDWRSAFLIALQRAMAQSQRDILMFLPGMKEIKQATDLALGLLDRHAHNADSTADDWQLTPLYGDLPFEHQQQAIMPIKNKRKLILATNIAETSVTIEGVDCVIDSGLMRQNEFDPNVGFDRLILKKISQSSATQRAGRAGRLSAGKCFRLWSKSDNLRADAVAEISRSDLAPLALELANWGSLDPAQLSLLDKPNDGAYQQAIDLLASLSAIENGKITTHGRNMLALGVHPRIAHMLLKSVKLAALELACMIAVMLDEKDIFVGQSRFNPDFLQRLSYLTDENSSQNQTQLLEAQQIDAQQLKAPQLKSQHLTSRTAVGLTRKSLAKLTHGVDKRRLKQIKKQAAFLLKRVKSSQQGNLSNQKSAIESLSLAAILMAFVFPERIAQRRGQGYLMANGSGVQISEHFEMIADFLVIIKLGGQKQSTQIYQAIEIGLNEFESYLSELIDIQKKIIWDVKQLAVKAESQSKLGAILIASSMDFMPSSSQILNCLVDGILEVGLDKLPWSNELRQWQARVNRLHQLAEFESVFPDLSDATLVQNLSSWLAPYLCGMSRFSQIKSDTLYQALTNCLSWELQQQLDQLMPTRIYVASGSSIKLDYLQGEQPVLAVKLQEMFGEKQSPIIANGKIKVLIHLLSPAKRPLQITQDLASFWQNSYQQVKKEMKGRYPKHPWPDDPLTAVATAKTKKHLRSQ